MNFVYLCCCFIRLVVSDQLRKWTVMYCTALWNVENYNEIMVLKHTKKRQYLRPKVTVALDCVYIIYNLCIHIILLICTFTFNSCSLTIQSCKIASQCTINASFLLGRHVAYASNHIATNFCN